MAVMKKPPSLAQRRHENKQKLPTDEPVIDLTEDFIDDTVPYRNASRSHNPAARQSKDVHIT